MRHALMAAALLFSATAMAEPQDSVRIAITFDDLPAQGELPAGLTRLGVAQEIVAALKAGGIPPTYGFVNGALIESEPAAAPVLTLWRTSGNRLGNHTWSHPGLSGLGVADFEANVVRNEPVIAAADSDWHWFRYPYLDEGKDSDQRNQVRAFLAGRGYRIAAVSTGLNDWAYPAPYTRCLARNDTGAIAQLESMYLKRAAEGLAYAQSQARMLYGRDIAHIQLLHIGSFQAHMLGKLIAMYCDKGARFISLEEATTDPVYAGYADPSRPAPPPDMKHAIAERGLPVPPAPFDHADELAALCR